MRLLSGDNGRMTAVNDDGRTLQRWNGMRPWSFVPALALGILMLMEDQEQVKARLAGLRAEHRDLDDAITALAQRSVPDLLQLQRLKKRKLQIKDQITQIEGKMLPDIIA